MSARVTALLVGVLCLLVGAGVGYALGNGSDDGSGSARTTAASTSVDSADAAEAVDRCIDLWNSPANDTRRSALRDWRATRNVYVHVGPPPDFPHECEITAGITGPGDIALVFQQVGGVSLTGPTFDPGAGTRRALSKLPAAQKVWNAKLSSDGRLQPDVP